MLRSAFKKFGSYVTLTLLLITAALEPSIINSVYYLIFLFGCTAWSLNFFSKKILVFLFSLAGVNSLIQIVATFLYQTNIGRSFIDFNFNMRWDFFISSGTLNFLPSAFFRLLGLVDFAEYECGGDDRVLIVNTKLSLSSWLSPVSILLLYHFTIYEIYFLLRKDPPEVSTAFGTFSFFLRIIKMQK